MARNIKPEPSFEERLAAANAKAAAATSVFEVLASDLEKAAQEREVLAQDVFIRKNNLLAEIEALDELRYQAENQAQDDYFTADKIRTFVGN